MIKNYICENLCVVIIYYKVQMYSKNYSNNYKTWWSTTIYWIGIDCTISISIEKFDSYDFTKNIWTSFSFKWA
jgi:hypothetical protein